MARRDLRHSDFRMFTKNMEIVKREIRELRPEADPHQNAIIHNAVEQRLVMKFLLARKADEQRGTTAATEAFYRDRLQARMLRKILARIPIPAERAVNQ